MTYLNKIARALEFVEEHLTEKFSLQDIAKAACMSPYHFHRVFQFATGEIIGEYVRKRRISCAAEDLLKTSKKVIEIAYGYGFDSVEAFSRSFKNQMLASPLHYRQKNFYDRKLIKSPILPDVLKHIVTGGISIIPKFVELEAFKTIGFYGEDYKAKILDKWRWAREEFNTRKAEIPNVVSADVYNLYPPVAGIDIRNQVMETKMKIMVGLKVDNLDGIPHGMTGYTVEGGKYAVFTHKGNALLGSTFSYIFNIWFSVNDYELDERTDFYILGDRFIPNSADSEIDIYIPVTETAQIDR